MLSGETKLTCKRGVELRKGPSDRGVTDMGVARIEEESELMPNNSLEQTEDSAAEARNNRGKGSRDGI